MGRLAGVSAEETKQRILDAATKVFAEEGYAGATMRRIGLAAQVNVATVAYHFGDKRGLYEAVIASLYRDLAKVAEEFDFGPGDPVARLVKVGWNFVLQHRNTVRVLVKHVVETGKTSENFAEEWFTHRIGGVVENFSLATGMDAQEIRLNIVSFNYLTSRYAVNSPEELCRVVGVTDVLEAEAAVEKYLITLARLAFRLPPAMEN